MLWLARRFRPPTFRGVGGSGRSPQVLAEIWFAWIAVPVFAIGWLWLNRPFLAVSALLFMAWGDCVTRAGAGGDLSQGSQRTLGVSGHAAGLPGHFLGTNSSFLDRRSRFSHSYGNGMGFRGYRQD